MGEDIPIDRYVANFFIALAIGLQLLIYCFFGNELTWWGLEIGRAAYNTPWYQLTPKLRRYIVLIMLRSQKPNYMVGKKLVVCSMQSYAAVRVFLLWVCLWTKPHMCFFST